MTDDTDSYVPPWLQGNSSTPAVDDQATGGDDYVPSWLSTAATPPTQAAEPPSSSAGGAFARGAMQEAAPNLGGMVAGMAAGAAVGGIPGAVVGLGVGAGAGYLISKGQDWLLDKLGLSNPAQEQADVEQHPYAREAGGLATTALALSPGNAGTTLGRRLFSGAVMGGVDAGQQAYQTGEAPDATSVAMSALTGFALPTARAPLANLEAGAAKIGQKFRPGRPNVPVTPEVEQDRTDVKPERTATPDAIGTAMEQPPAAEVPDIGNQAVQPTVSDKGSNYVKKADTGAQGKVVETAPTQVGINMDEVKPEEVVALTPEGEPVPQQGGASLLPEQKPIESGLAEQQPAAPARPAGASLLPDAAQPPAPEAQVPRAPAAPEAQVPRAPAAPEAQVPRAPAAPERPTGASLLPEGAQPPIQTGLVEAAAAAPRRPKVVDKAVEALRAMGHDRVVDAIEAAPAEKQAEYASKALAMIHSKTGEATGTKVARVPTKRPTLEGSDITGRDAKDIARKQTALDAAKSAYAKFGQAPDNETPSAVMDRAKAGVAHAREQNGGKSPVQSYKPREKPAEYQWVQAAEKVLKKPTPAAMSEFATTEKLLRGGGAKDVQQTKRVDADIQRSARPTSEEADLAKPAEDQSTAAREDFEHMPAWKEGAVESKSYIDASNNLRDWINDLGDEDYRSLEGALHDPTSPETSGIRRLVETTSYPRRLHLMLEAELEGAQMDRANRTMSSPPSRTPVKSAKDLLTAAEQKALAERHATFNSKRVLEDTSEAPPEPAKGASLLEDKAGKLEDEADKLLATPNTQSTEPMARKVTERGRSGRPISSAPPNKAATEAVEKGTYNEAQNKFKTMASDVNGKLVMKPLEWMKQRIDSAFSPAADADARDYAKSLGDSFHRLAGRSVNIAMKLLQNANSVTKGMQNAKRMRQVYRALEDGSFGSLDDEQKQFIKDHIDPMRRDYEQAYDELRELNETHKLGLDMPERSDGFVPKLREMPITKEGNDGADVIVGRRAMSLSADTLKERDFFSLQDANGDRFLIKPDADGEKAMVWKNGKTKKINIPPNVDLTKIGQKLKIGTMQYTVDHAWAREIMANVKDENGKKLAYHENPLYNWSQATSGVKNALLNAKERIDLLNSKQLAQFSTRDKAIADERGYIQSKLPETKGLYMAQPIAHTLDDFAKPGFDDATMERWRQANTALAKLIYVTPVPHALNEAALWFIGRGMDWFNPSAYKTLGSTMMEAMKSVTKQDHAQSYMREHQGNPMLGGSLTRDLMPQIAKIGGMEIDQNPDKWNPIAKAFGLEHAAQLSKALYDASTKSMWWFSDILLTQRFLENQKKGMSGQAAAEEAHKFISDYRVPGDVGTGKMSRLVSKILQDPATSLFGRYRLGLWKAVANTSRAVVKGTPQEKKDAVGHILATALLGMVVYPMLDKAAQAVTGNPDAEARRRGLMSPLNTINEIRKGHKNLASLGTEAYTPPVLGSALSQLWENKDWRGKDIVGMGDIADVGGPDRTLGQRARALGRVGVQAGEAAARTLVSPLSTAEQMGANQQGVGASLRDMALDIKNPSDAARKFADTQDHRNQQEQVRREKKPPGILERIYNSTTE